MQTMSGGGHILRCGLIRWSGITPQGSRCQKEEWVLAHVLASACKLKQQQDWEFSCGGVSGTGWRVLQHSWGQNPVVDEEKKTYQVRILDIKQI